MPRSALILAGGQGSRLGYREKALLDINGKPLISYAISAIEDIVDEVIISVRDKVQGELVSRQLPGYKLAFDMQENTGPLAGILAGLRACMNEYCFVAACDMPFINGTVVEMLFETCWGHGASIPRWNDGFLEPLHAVYRREPMILETERAIERRETVILAPVLRLDVNFVDMDEIRRFDPGLKTFMNINTPEDIARMSGGS